MNLSRTDDDPRNWDECRLMTEYFNDHVDLSVKLMMYQQVRINLYDTTR